MPASSRETGVKPQEFIEFDYVIVGGGTAGLTVAARLSEDQQVTVGVLEAGKWRPDDDKINIPGFIGQSLMDPDYDFCLSTIPQVHSNNREWTWPRGKSLGGSSNSNFLVFQRGAKQEYDNFSSFTGGKGDWSWKDFVKYASKSTHFHEASSEVQKANHANGIKETHDFEGKKGPLQISYSHWFADAQKQWFSALKSLGLNQLNCGLGGENTGIWTSPATVCPNTKKRSSAASAYYEPNKDRANLKVLCDAHATSISLSSDSTPKAIGVHFESEGKAYHVKARKEVILSAGSIQSPQLLELSGIGGKELLEKHGVELKVENPNVGENLQEHLYVGSTYELKPGSITWDKMRNPEFGAKEMEKYNSNSEDRGLAASAFSGFAYFPLSQFMNKEEVEELKKDVKSQDWSKHSKAVQKGVEKTLEWIEEGEKKVSPSSTIPMMELIFAPGFFGTGSAPKPDKEYFTILSCLQHPFSRGNIHIQTKDPKKPPAIDPHYFEVASDLAVMAKAVKYCDQIVEAEALKGEVARRQDPDAEKYKTEKDYEEFVKDFCVTEYHHIGTCTMASKEEGGVVDERLRVYGVEGLRVVDASIIPLHVSSHIVSAVYAIGEKAADMIKADA